LFAHGRWFSPGTPASSTTKTGCHDIAESGIKHNQNQNQIHGNIDIGSQPALVTTSIKLVKPALVTTSIKLQSNLL
jgi:hypothetical protein